MVFLLNQTKPLEATNHHTFVCTKKAPCVPRDQKVSLEDLPSSVCSTVGPGGNPA